MSKQLHQMSMEERSEHESMYPVSDSELQRRMNTYYFINGEARFLTLQSDTKTDKPKTPPPKTPIPPLDPKEIGKQIRK